MRYGLTGLGPEGPGGGCGLGRTGQGVGGRGDGGGSDWGEGGVRVPEDGQIGRLSARWVDGVLKGRVETR